jgi:hypothetical protein
MVRLLPLISFFVGSYAMRALGLTKLALTASLFQSYSYFSLHHPLEI